MNPGLAEHYLLNGAKIDSIIFQAETINLFSRQSAQEGTAGGFDQEEEQQPQGQEIREQFSGFVIVFGLDLGFFPAVDLAENVPQ